LLKKGEWGVLTELLKFFETSEPSEEPRAAATPHAEAHVPPVVLTEPEPREIWQTLTPLEGDSPSESHVVDAVDWVTASYIYITFPHS